MDLLARREHGVAELQRKLVDKGLDRELVEQAVTQLAADGLVSDARFTESFIASRRQRGQGPVKVRYELRARQVPDSVIDACLDERDPDWRDALKRVIEKKYRGRLSGTPATRSKQVKFLVSRGFTPDLIRQVQRGEDPYD